MPALTNSKHELFALAIAQGRSAGQAYVSAGYAKNDGNAARLKNNEKVGARIQELMAAAAEKAGVTIDWVLEGLIKNYERAMQATEIKLSGSPTGEFKYDGAVANKSLELIGRHLGMFKEKIEHSGPGGGPIETKDVSDGDRARALAAFLAKTKVK